MTNERIAAAWAYHTMQQDWDSLSENARHLYESDVRDIRKALDVLGLEIVEKQADDAELNKVACDNCNGTGIVETNGMDMDCNDCCGSGIAEVD